LAFILTIPPTPVPYWRCPNCGQVHFGDSPPDMCAFCQDFTTWQRLEEDDIPTTPNLAATPSAPSGDQADSDTQLPLFKE